MPLFSFKSFVRGIGFAALGLLAAGAVLVFTSAVLLAQDTADGSALSAQQQTTLEMFDDYTGFAPYDAGIILPEQITADVFADFIFIDTRTDEEFAAQTINGARHIEWREVFARIDEIPTDRKVVLFCNTGALSAQSAFGLRALGYENVLILQTGFLGWIENAQSSDKT